MGWIQKLNEVYDAAMVMGSMGEDGEEQLLPVGFVEKKIKYLVTLRADGTFSSARELTKEELYCAIPSLPAAESRTSGIGSPFPLAEQMKYLVCREGEENPRLELYLDQLKQWCEQPDAPDCLRKLYDYLSKKTLLRDMQDIARLDVKYVSETVDTTTGEVVSKPGADAKEFVDFAMEGGDDTARLGMRKNVKESWSRYRQQLSDGEVDLCYATGTQAKRLDKHPKVRGNAKLISAEDAAYRFQYKGRFVEDRSAATVSEGASLKAHNALKWLMDKQGFSRYGLYIVAWNVMSGALEVPVEEPDEDEDDEPKMLDTFSGYAQALRDATEGHGDKLKAFQKKIGDTSEREQRIASTVVMGMEAATDGRMSINYYQEMPGNVYAERLEVWYCTCCWEYPKYVTEGTIRYIQTPTPLMIARAVMGSDSVQRALADVKCKKSDAKQMRDLYKRLLFCMVEGQALPRNLVTSAVHRAEFPLSFQDGNKAWVRKYWEECIRTTCALIRKRRIDTQTEDEMISSPRLQRNCTDRSYLYGRLFAVADVIERNARTGEDNLPTNAVRWMQAFVHRPAETWKLLHSKLIPYLGTLGAKNLAGYYQYLFGEIERKFTPQDRASNRPLNENFLIGIYAQNRELYTKAEEQSKQPMEDAVYMPIADRSELFGCLLAVADCIEEQAEQKPDTPDDGENAKQGARKSEHEGRTHALREMQRFAEQPAETWVQIHAEILPYLQKIGVKGEKFYGTILHELECGFVPEERQSNAPLNSMFLHGYYCMRSCIRQKGQCFQMPKREQMPQSISREIAFGTLLALENYIERRALDAEKTEEENRSSNAVRFMSTFPHKPWSNWQYLRERLTPYEKKIRRLRAGWADTLHERIESQERSIVENGWNTDEPLNADWLHEYYVHYDGRKGEL